MRMLGERAVLSKDSMIVRPCLRYQVPNGCEAQLAKMLLQRFATRNEESVALGASIGA